MPHCTLYLLNPAIIKRTCVSYSIIVIPASPSPTPLIWRLPGVLSSTCLWRLLRCFTSIPSPINYPNYRYPHHPISFRSLSSLPSFLTQHDTILPSPFIPFLTQDTLSSHSHLPKTLSSPHSSPNLPKTLSSPHSSPNLPKTLSSPQSPLP